MKLLVTVAAVALTLAGPAMAQAGRSGHSTSSPATNVKAFNELRSYGICLARNQRTRALQAIATQPGSDEEKKALNGLVYGEKYSCIFGGTEMTFPTLFARGILAEGLLRSGGVPAQYQLTSLEPADKKDLHGVARCYVNGHRAEAEAVLATAPASPEELKAIAAAWEDFRTCMPGFNVQLNAPWIRFLMAEALLRLPPAAPAAGS